MDLTSFDIIILILLGVVSIRGLFNGFIKELFSFGALVVGLLVAMALYKRLASFLTELIGSLTWIQGASFFIIFFIVFIILKALEHNISQMMEDRDVMAIDKLLGFILGFLEGVVFCSLLTYFIGFQNIVNSEKILTGSFFVPYFTMIFPFLESTGSAVLNSINN